MRQITQSITSAFVNRVSKKVGNSYTNGNELFLHKNKIAEFRDGELWISSGGWCSNTTKERLNSLPGVRIHQKNFDWFLNGTLWDGSWIKVS